MKTTFYGIMAEFYNKTILDSNGNKIPYVDTKAEITDIKPLNKKPNNQFRQEDGMTAFKIWLTSENRAKTILGLIKSGEIYIDDLISFYNGCLPLEGRAA